VVTGGAPGSAARTVYSLQVRWWQGTQPTGGGKGRGGGRWRQGQLRGQQVSWRRRWAVEAEHRQEGRGQAQSENCAMLQSCWLQPVPCCQTSVAAASQPHPQVVTACCGGAGSSPSRLHQGGQLPDLMLRQRIPVQHTCQLCAACLQGDRGHVAVASGLHTVRMADLGEKSWAQTFASSSMRPTLSKCTPSRDCCSTALAAQRPAAARSVNTRMRSMEDPRAMTQHARGPLGLHYTR
jgi:hypothetical protein